MKRSVAELGRDELARYIHPDPVMRAEWRGIDIPAGTISLFEWKGGLQSEAFDRHNGDRIVWHAEVKVNGRRLAEQFIHVRIQNDPAGWRQRHINARFVRLCRTAEEFFKFTIKYRRHICIRGV